MMTTDDNGDCDDDDCDDNEYDDAAAAAAVDAATADAGNDTANYCNIRSSAYNWPYEWQMAT